MLCRENVSETENVWSTEFISALLLLQCWMLFVHGWGDTSRMTEPCSTHRHHLHLAAPTVASSTDCYRLVLKGIPQTKMLDQAQVGASSQKSGAGASEQSHPWIVISSCWTTWTWKQKLFPMKKIICFTLLLWNVSQIKGMYHNVFWHLHTFICIKMEYSRTDSDSDLFLNEWLVNIVICSNIPLQDCSVPSSAVISYQILQTFIIQIKFCNIKVAGI